MQIQSVFKKNLSSERVRIGVRADVVLVSVRHSARHLSWLQGACSVAGPKGRSGAASAPALPADGQPAAEASVVANPVPSRTTRPLCSERGAIHAEAAKIHVSSCGSGKIIVGRRRYVRQIGHRRGLDLHHLPTLALTHAKAAMRRLPAWCFAWYASNAPR